MKERLVLKRRERDRLDVSGVSHPLQARVRERATINENCDNFPNILGHVRLTVSLSALDVAHRVVHPRFLLSSTVAAPTAVVPSFPHRAPVQVAGREKLVGLRFGMDPQCLRRVA